MGQRYLSFFDVWFKSWIKFGLGPTGNVSSIDSCRYFREGLSRDAEHYGKAQNIDTSWFARQTGSAIIFPFVIDWFAPFSQEGAFSGWPTKLESLKCENSANQSITGRKMLALPVWGAKQEVMPFSTSPLPSTSRKTSSLRKRRESVNYRQENAGTSCLTSKAGGEVILNFTNMFSIPRNPHPEKYGMNQSIYGRKMLTLPVFQESLLASLSSWQTFT